MKLLIATLLVGVLSALQLVAQDKPAAATGKRSDYVSDASFFVGTYSPPKCNHSPKSMAAAGKAFVESLNEKLRARGAMSLDNQERREWTNLPPAPNAGGVRLGDLNEAQLNAACNLMAEVFSESGYTKMCEIMLGDDQLLASGRPSQGIGTVDFSIMVFGEPSETEPWAMQLDGHHIGVNIALQGGDYSFSPSFIGCQPEEFKIADKKFRPFAGEVDDATSLISSLSDDQRKLAVLSPKRGLIRTGPGADGTVPDSLGVPCSGFNKSQREKLTKLIANWVSAMPPAHAEKRMKDISAELDQMHFSWNGQTAPRSDISYMIQGPTLIIEFSCQGNGDKPFDHTHSMYRDPTNEYGQQVKTK